MQELITIALIFSPFIAYNVWTKRRKKRREREQRVQEDYELLMKEAQNRKFIETHKHLKPEEILFLEELDRGQKIFLLKSIHNYSSGEAWALVDESNKAKKKAKTKLIKRKISQKAEELYGSLPKSPRRQPIPDDVKLFVWQRDKGQCVKCGSQQKLEYDHIIPHSKGGSDSARNLQLLCEACNRQKSAQI